MRTEKEIKEWLKKSDFYSQYESNLREGNTREEEIYDFLNGRKYENTILSAFDWCDTSEGEDYWNEIDDNFREWYNNKEESSDNQETHGRKNDIIDDKLRWDLLPLKDIEEIVKVFHAGAKKYGDNNWQNLDNGYERYKAALFRHLLEVEKGNEKDEDTGCYHIAQVATNAIFMLHIKLNEYRKKDEQN